MNFSTLSLSPIQNVYRSRKPISLPYHTCKRSSPPQIEHTSTISAISPSTSTSTSGFTLTLSSSAPILTDCHIGDSICVNGACLTVTEFDSDSFKVGLAPETLKRTNLGQVKVGDKVNCERAMAAHTRFGGHMVQVSNPFLLLLMGTEELSIMRGSIGPCRRYSDHHFQNPRRRLYPVHFPAPRYHHASPIHNRKGVHHHRRGITHHHTRERRRTVFWYHAHCA